MALTQQQIGDQADAFTVTATGAIPSAIVVKELTGDQRTITIRYRALPYRSVPFPGDQRIVKTTYPGNPISSVQVLGPEEGQSVLHGIWKDRFLSGPVDPAFGGNANTPPVDVNGQPKTTAMDVHLLFEDVRRKGQILDVTWDRITRRGFLVKYNPKVIYSTDIEWEMTFDWVSLGETEPPVGIKVTDVAQVAASMQQRASAILTAAQAIVAPLQSGVVQDLQDSLTSMQEQVGNLSDAVSNFAAGAVNLGTTVARTPAMLGNLQGTAETVNQSIQDLAPSRLAALAGNGPAGLPTLGQTLQVELYRRQILDASRQLQWEAAEQASDLAGQSSEPSLLAVYVAKGTDDLRTVSSKFYGTPDNWRVLMEYNGFTSSALSAGQVVYIPAITSATTTTVVNSGAMI